MAEAATRPVMIEGSLELRPSDLAERVANLERVQANPPKKKDFWDKLQATGISTFLSSALLAWMGFLLTGAVTSSIQQRQLELNSVEKMQSLIKELADPSVSENTATVDITTLAAFGEPSVPAFANLLISTDSHTMEIGDRGLRLVGSAHRDSVCAQLTSVLRNRSKAYSWRTFRRTINLVGDLNCQSSQPALKSIATSLASSDAFTAIVSDRPETSEYAEVKKSAHEVLQRLESQPKPSTWWHIKRFFSPGKDRAQQFG
jgi:hypothetical protein